MRNLADFIPTYEDFPKKGISFKDVLEILQEPEIFKELIIEMSSNQIIKDSQAIVSVDARGFIFGSAIAFQTSKPMICARKPARSFDGAAMHFTQLSQQATHSLEIPI